MLSGSACVVLEFGRRFTQQHHVRGRFSLRSLAYARLVSCVGKKKLYRV